MSLSNEEVIQRLDDYLHGLLDDETAADNMAVLGQRDLLASTMSSLRIRLTDHNTKQPLANVPVTIDLQDRTGRSVQLTSLTTDALGGAEPRFQVPNVPEGAGILTIT